MFIQSKKERKNSKREQIHSFNAQKKILNKFQTMRQKSASKEDNSA
jgi:hypothetical protein